MNQKFKGTVAHSTVWRETISKNRVRPKNAGVGINFLMEGNMEITGRKPDLKSPSHGS
ncbi:hypothetical protein [Dysgonomonas termitidis]|uniref:Uncharacterized protein n=1 Tax=Dysgonomonas termitidis TaxID=1516126 RepID=A0ABV9KVV4_9BACT